MTSGQLLLQQQTMNQEEEVSHWKPFEPLDDDETFQIDKDKMTTGIFKIKILLNNYVDLVFE